MKLRLLTFLFVSAFAFQNNFIFAMSAEEQEQQRTLDSQLLYKLDFGNASEVKDLLEAGASPYVKYINSQNFSLTALHLAACRGDNPEILRVILRKLGQSGGPVDVNIRFSREDGDTLLHHAIFSYNNEMVDILLESGADVNMPVGMDSGMPMHPAYLAIRWGQIKILDCMLAHHNKAILKNASSKINPEVLSNLVEKLKGSARIQELCTENECLDIQSNSYLSALTCLIDLAQKLNLPSLLSYLEEQRQIYISSQNFSDGELIWGF